MSNCSYGVETCLVLAVTKGDAVYQGMDSTNNQLCVFWKGSDYRAECILCLLLFFSSIKTNTWLFKLLWVELTTRPHHHAYALKYIIFFCQKHSKTLLINTSRLCFCFKICISQILRDMNFLSAFLKFVLTNYSPPPLGPVLIYLHGSVHFYEFIQPKTHFKSFFWTHLVLK